MINQLEHKEETIAGSLLQWYDQNRRTLPWRGEKDPYKIWVSEIMLQQTRVDTVIPYYNQFMERFPSAAALAEADDETVLSYWQGLGYYSRVRNLHQGVKEVVQTYAGEIPCDFDALRELPGIGEYTAGAILSMAFNERCPAIDGNVIRVFSRLFAYTGNTATSKGKKEIKNQVTQVLEKVDRIGDFNQALMDLGSAVCTPKSPNCSLCPLHHCCEAYQAGAMERYPVKPAKTTVQNIAVWVGILKQNEEYLIFQRPKSGLLAGLWQFPNLETPQEKAAEIQQNQLLQNLFQGWGYETAVQQDELKIQHVFSHRKWFMTVRIYEVQHIQEGVAGPDALHAWVNQQSAAEILWAGPHGKIARWLGLLP